MARLSIAKIIEALEAVGRLTFTLDDVLACGYSASAARQALWREQKAGRLLMPARGFYVIIAPQFRKAGTPNPVWYIDPWMGYMENPYYVGLLSAASYYGATHHAVMETQVLTARQFPSSTVGKARFRFFTTSRFQGTPIRRHQTSVGSFAISTVAATAVDLVIYADKLGGPNAIATALAEISEESLTPKELRSCLGCMDVPTTDLQRLGWLFEHLEVPKLAAEISRVLKGRATRSILLSPRGCEQSGFRHPTWKVIENVEVEVDV